MSKSDFQFQSSCYILYLTKKCFMHVQFSHVINLVDYMINLDHVKICEIVVDHVTQLTTILN